MDTTPQKWSGVEPWTEWKFMPLVHYKAQQMKLKTTACLGCWENGWNLLAVAVQTAWRFLSLRTALVGWKWRPLRPVGSRCTAAGLRRRWRTGQRAVVRRQRRRWRRRRLSGRHHGRCRRMIVVRWKGIVRWWLTYSRATRAARAARLSLLQYIHLYSTTMAETIQQYSRKYIKKEQKHLN